MKTKLAILAITIALTACTDDRQAVRAVEAMGMTNVHTTGYRAWGCSEDDTFRTGFTATTANGDRVSGVVCSAPLKGATVRMD